MFEQESFSTPRMRTAYHLEVVPMDYCFGIVKHRLMPKLGCPISVRLRGGLGSLHSPNDDRNYTYSQLVVTSNGGMGEECKMFMKHLAEKLAEKDVEGYPIVISWLRTRISFEILKSVNTSIGGSRQPFFRREVVDDFKVNCTAADLLL